jgi:hypothetical protein
MFIYPSRKAITFRDLRLTCHFFRGNVRLSCILMIFQYLNNVKTNIQNMKFISCSYGYPGTN